MRRFGRNVLKSYRSSTYASIPDDLLSLEDILLKYFGERLTEKGIRKGFKLFRMHADNATTPDEVTQIKKLAINVYSAHEGRTSHDKLLTKEYGETLRSIRNADERLRTIVNEKAGGGSVGGFGAGGRVRTERQPPT